MADPSVSITILDNQLGILSPSVVGTLIVFGTCTTGTPNTIYGSASVSNVIAALGAGKLVEAAANLISKTGGALHYFVPVTASVVGANSAVTKSNSGAPTLSLTDTPVNDYNVIVQMMLGGARGTATFKYSLNGGDTWSAVFTTAATNLLGTTGVTLNWATGTYVLGDTYSFTCTAPGFSTTNLGDAITAVLAVLGTSINGEGFWVTGLPADASACAANASTLDSALTTAEAQDTYLWGLVEGPLESNASDSQMEAAFVAFASKRVCVCAGTADVNSDVTRGSTSRSSIANVVVPRIAAIPLSQDPAFVGAPQGSIPGINTGTTLTPNGLWRDENIVPGLGDARFITLRTLRGVAGIYVTSTPTMAASGSDFSFLPNRRVMDQFDRTLYKALVPYLNADEITASGGILDPGVARKIGANVAGQCANALGGNVSKNPDGTPKVDVVIGTTNDILSDSTMYATGTTRPKGYIRNIVATSGFVTS